jgi:ParB family transcriptional regulator, chromosome partitioning protein
MAPKRVSLADRAAQDSTQSPSVADAPVAPSMASALWSEEIARQEVVALDVAQLMPNRRQPRTIFDQVALEELAASIREHGVIQPIIVRPIPLTKWEGHARRYELIAGERRWRASILAEQATIPALIREDATDHGKMIELALIENLQRADLHPLEEACAFGVMRAELGYSYRKIAERVGRSKGYVENRLKLLDLDDDLQQLVHDRPDTLMHVVELAKVPDLTARATLIAAVREGLSYPETQARVRALIAPATSAVADEVSLYKDTHDRLPDGDHAPATAGEYRVQPAQAAGAHDRLPSGDDVPIVGDSAIVPLNARERAALSGLGNKLEQWIENPARLVVADWEALAPIAVRLRDLLRRMQEA